MKISFDFDHTLSQPTVQDFARQLAAAGWELWIVTMRFDTKERMERYYRERQELAEDWQGNDDLFQVARQLGIPRRRVIFTNWQWKSRFLARRRFILHVDDCKYLLGEIRKKRLPLRVLNCWNNHRWQKVCLDVLRRWKENHGR